MLCFYLCMAVLIAACQTAGNVETSHSTISTTTKRIVEVPVLTDLPEPSGGVVRIEGAGETTKATSTVDSDYRWKAFNSQGVSVAPGDDMKHLLRELGDPKSTYEAPSCLFEGNDRVYSYQGFDINMAIIDGKEICVAVFLTDESVKTPEGLTIGSSLAEMQKAFGDHDEEETGQYTWRGENSELVIVVIEDKVTSISYLMKKSS